MQQFGRFFTVIFGANYYELFTNFWPITNHLRSIILQYLTVYNTIRQMKNRDTATFAGCIAVFTLAE